MHPTRALLKPPAGIRRLPLTTKNAPHDYYKGNRTGAMGRHTMYGGYIIEWHKVRTYVCPDLRDFNLTPFVAQRIKQVRDSFTHTETGNAMDGKEYLRKWKEEGGNI